MKNKISKPRIAISVFVGLGFVPLAVFAIFSAGMGLLEVTFGSPSDAPSGEPWQVSLPWLVAGLWGFYGFTKMSWRWIQRLGVEPRIVLSAVAALAAFTGFTIYVFGFEEGIVSHGVCAGGLLALYQAQHFLRSKDPLPPEASSIPKRQQARKRWAWVMVALSLPAVVGYTLMSAWMVLENVEELAMGAFSAALLFAASWWLFVQAGKATLAWVRELPMKKTQLGIATAIAWALTYMRFPSSLLLVPLTLWVTFLLVTALRVKEAPVAEAPQAAG